MTARARMKMRTSVQRNTSTGGSWGGPGVPGWDTHIEDLPCFAWVDDTVEVVANKVSVVSRLTVLVPSGTDVKSTDRLTDITDRLGHVFFPGPAEIRSVKHGPAWLELIAVTAR